MRIQLRQPHSFSQLGAREEQEDARFPDMNQPDAQSPCFLVCDGVGGKEGGKIASQTVCQVFGRAMQGYDSCHQALTIANFSKILDAAFSELDRIAEKIPECAEMGTTLTFVCLGIDGVLAAHMGDSRIYHIRPGAGILYRSNDHSLVNALVHEGKLTPDEAIGYSGVNYVTRCMCPTSDNQERCCASVVNIKDIVADDYLILCSDGVLHEIDDQMLIDLLDTSLSNAEKIKLLANTCMCSEDNNTLILLQVASVDEKETIETEGINLSTTRQIIDKGRLPLVSEMESIKTRSQSLLSRLINHVLN